MIAIPFQKAADRNVATRPAPSWKGAVLPGLLLLIWAVAVWSPAAPGAWPSIPQVVRRGVQEVANGTLPAALGVSLLRDLQGLVIGATAGIAAGVGIGLNRTISRMITPSLHVFKLISTFAWIPLIMTWFGLGEGSKIAFIALVSFLPVLFNTLEGVSGVPRELVELGRVQRFTAGQFVFRLALPWATPSIFTGLSLALIATWMGTIGAEYMLTSGGGIGAFLVQARDSFEMDRLIVGVIVVGIVGMIFQKTGAAVERRLLIWRATLDGENSR